MNKEELLNKYVNLLFENLAKGNVPEDPMEKEMNIAYSNMSPLEQEEYGKERINDIELEKETFLNNEFDMESLENWCKDSAYDLFEQGYSLDDNEVIMKEAYNVTFSFVGFYERKAIEKCMSLAYDFIKKELNNLITKQNDRSQKK